MDGTRQLTVEGQRQAKEMAAFMVRHIGRVDTVISSPFARAVETAEVMADALGAHVVTTRLLEPDQKPEEMWPEVERIAQASRYVLLVGHDPSINLLLAWLINGGVVRFEHGAIAHVKAATKDIATIAPRVEARLHWLVDVKIVERDVLEDVAEAAQEFAAALS
jgi:phosphohistidine phosphatase SixA